LSLVLQNLSVTTPQSMDVFSAVDMVIANGEVACVMGPSGIGKSTLLNAIGGHLSTHFSVTGEVLLNGQKVTHKSVAERQIGILFQDPLLFPHLTVGDNLAFGLSPNVVGAKNRRAQIEQALEQAQLQDFYHRNPATLSGGQQSRIALMRALLAQPKALLLDEPFSKLDLELRHTMREFLFAQAKQRHIPMLLATHEPTEANTANGPLIILNPV
jgi:putative thiamine transport system ATP-binding protein